MQKKLLASLLLSACLMLQLSANAGKAAQPVKTLTVTSSSLSQGAIVPKKFTGDGADVSPQISWTAGPKATKSYALFCADPDAPDGTFWHWTVFNINPKTLALSENMPKIGNLPGGALQGSNDARTLGYFGPAPPPGKVHHYEFRIFALDTSLALRPGVYKDALKAAIKGHILAEGQLSAIYRR